MQKAWDRYQKFDFEIVELCHPDDLMIREQVYLDKSIGNPLNMNISSKALPGFHSNHSDETKKKISQANKGRKFSKSHREKLRYKRSDETRRKMSEAAKNRSEETIEKIRKTLTGHTVSNETRKKIARKLKGTKLSAQHKESISRGLLSHYERNRS
jgi:signal recognition particle GTPase